MSCRLHPGPANLDDSQEMSIINCFFIKKKKRLSNCLHVFFFFVLSVQVGIPAPAQLVFGASEHCSMLQVLCQRGISGLSNGINASYGVPRWYMIKKRIQNTLTTLLYAWIHKQTPIWIWVSDELNKEKVDPAKIKFQYFNSPCNNSS